MLQQTDAVNQWCLRKILYICWHDFVRNADTCRITNEPSLSSITKSHRLTFFGQLAQMDENADASQDKNLPRELEVTIRVAAHNLDEEHS